MRQQRRIWWCGGLAAGLLVLAWGTTTLGTTSPQGAVRRKIVLDGHPIMAMQTHPQGIKAQMPYLIEGRHGVSRREFTHYLIQPGYTSSDSSFTVREFAVRRVHGRYHAYHVIPEA
ncbi:hypothetical protein FD13_GL001674 [Levilactobacillus senmaizukei DSM 21775 = NBRC 103853]|uniref:Uncharacterized protein n=1 Tax=Levilactobacillus senmaizukei DSM 21775 = NBRC 103853 TaxID=1423803 RepID=A0A0R2DF78_9LACO|nr:hypothetical protein [Levilactobacillus senmaizukei]KRN02680.1 hypothetical protein FD13_GL001674 [Levilactobacillus senmaizukei DSM 21775 = NBRC 103853]